MEQLDLGGHLSNNDRPIKILETVERVKNIKFCQLELDQAAFHTNSVGQFF
jgi:hypothetical protein